MKTIGTVLAYIFLIAIIPISTGFYLYFNGENKEAIISKIDKKIFFEQFTEYSKDSVTIKIRNMLIDKKFNELNKYFEELDKKYEVDISIEELLYISYDALAIKDIEYEEFFNSWIIFSPNSYVPYLGRGIFYYNMGWKERGNRWASETKDEQFEKMYKYFKKSKLDLDKSLVINQRIIYPYDTLIDMANTTSNEDEVEYLVKKALEINRHSLKIRQRYLKTISPRWSGSYEKMTDYVDNIPIDLKANPKLKYLYGFIDSDKADMAKISSRYNQENRLLTKSLSLSGDYHSTIFKLGKNYVKQDKYKEGIIQLSKAIDIFKENSDYFYWRTIAYIDIKEFEKAKNDILYAYALNPFDKYIKKKKIYLGKVLNHEAYKLRKDNEIEQALNLYNIALQVDLENDSMYYGIAQTYIRQHDLESALDNIKIAIEINPNDINHYLLIDYLLAKNKDWNQIISYWDSFIKLYPDNGRAYSERGGAYYHKGDIKKAVENAKISGDLGNLEGKEAYEKFKHLVM